MDFALEKGVKGNFSLIDKVASLKTLGISWQKVQSNAGVVGLLTLTVRLGRAPSGDREHWC